MKDAMCLLVCVCLCVCVFCVYEIKANLTSTQSDPKNTSSLSTQPKLVAGVVIQVQVHGNSYARCKVGSNHYCQQVHDSKVPFQRLGRKLTTFFWSHFRVTLKPSGCKISSFHTSHKGFIEITSEFKIYLQIRFSFITMSTFVE